jgi:hypothetical protein
MVYYIMPEKYIKLGQFGKSLLYDEAGASGSVPAFETDGIVAFVGGGTIIISPTTTIVGSCWRMAAYYDADNYVKLISDTNDTSGWVLAFYIGGTRVAEVGMGGIEIIGLITEMEYASESVMTPRCSKHGELEYDAGSQGWEIGVPTDDTPDADFVRVAGISTNGHLRVYRIEETGAFYTSAESPIFVGVPYGWTPPLGALGGYTDLTSDMNHTALRLERVDVGGIANAILKTKVVSESVSF